MLRPPTSAWREDMRIFGFLAVWLVLLGAAAPARAQQTVDYASVGGRVLDASGGVLPGSTVTVTNAETNVASTAVADDQGRFRFPYLRVGVYDLTVSSPGFGTATRRLTLTVGAAFDVPVVLELGRVTSHTAVDVLANEALLEGARSQIAGTVSQAELQNLPLNGRNFLEVALLVPGVSPTNVASTQLFPETSAVPGVTLSVSSQRNLSNNFIVDGLSANDDAAALSGIAYGVDAIEQFQVVTSGAQAELGRALGGYVNVVTRSGSNRLRGTAYDFIRDDSLNARNALSGSRLPMDQSQFGASLGGPLVRNRTFYFTNVERRNLDQTGLTTITDGNVAAINARLRAVGYGGPPVATGIYANPVDTTNVFGRIDQYASDRDQFSVRYALYDVGSQNSRGAGGLNAPSASTGLASTDQTVSVSNTLVLSTRTVLETRAQFTHSDLAAPPTDLIGPSVSIAGVATFGTSSSSPTGRLNKLYQVVNNLSHQAGAHALRAGVDFLYNDDLVTYPRSARGNYSFSSLANFLGGVYNNAGFTQTFGVTQAAQTNPNLGFHVQDEWRLTSALTFNFGVRYDLQFLETVSTDTDNLSPRAGFAWVPFDSQRTIVRGSAGLFYDRVPLRAVANALLSARNTTDLGQLQQIAVSLSPAQAGAPVFPAILDAVVPSVTLVNLTTMDRGLQNAYSRQASAEVEQQLGARTTFSVGYQYLRGRNLLMSINQNVPSCVATGTNNGCRPNSGYANNSQVLGGRRLELSRPAFLAGGAAGGVVALPSFVHAVEVDEQPRRVLLQLADRSAGRLEGLGQVRRRSAAPPRALRQRPVADGAGRDALGIPDARLPGGRHGSGVLGAAVQHPVGGHDRPGDAGTADRRRRVHRSQRRGRNPLRQRDGAREPHLPPRSAPAARSAGRSLQPHQSRQRRHAQHHVRAGRLSGQPAARLRPGDRRRRTAVAAVWFPRQVLSASLFFNPSRLT